MNVFDALILESDITAAHAEFERTLKRGAEVVRCTIGWPSDHESGDVHWHPDIGVWFRFRGTGRGRGKHRGRWINFIGTTPPTTGGSVNIDMELNPPVSGRNLQCAGLFVRDREGTLYVAHTGKVGGGRKGIGKEAFLAWRAAQGLSALQRVYWPDGKHEEVIVVGPVTSPNLARHIQQFAQEVAEFKKAAVAGTLPVGPPAVAPSPKTNHYLDTLESDLSYAYTIERSVEAERNHGFVVNRLIEALKAAGHHATRDRQRDAMILSKGGRITHLFEVKTECTSTHLHQAVGQLMVYSLDLKPEPRRILVLPAPVPEAVRTVAQKLGLALVEHAIHGGSVDFKGLAARCKRRPPRFFS